MLNLVQTGTKAAIKAIRQDGKQTRFAAALALTRTAKLGMEVERREAARDLKNPVPFTLRGFRFEKATKTNLESRVYIMPIQSQYLAWQIEGGRRSKRTAVGEALPVNIGINRYGNIIGRKGGKLAKLAARPDTFIGVINGVKGLWQRGNSTRSGKFRASGGTRRRKLKQAAERLVLLVRFEQAVQYRPRFDFYAVGQRVLDQHFETEFDKALEYARSTAK